MDTPVQRAAEDLQADLGQRRMLLTADQLAGLVSPGVMLEQELGFEGERYWFFSISGVLNGAKLTGALFADSCILVRAPNETKAKDLAQRGLRHTVELLHEEFNTRNTRLLKSTEEITAAGRRARGEYHPTGKALEQKNLLAQMIRDALSGKA